MASLRFVAAVVLGIAVAITVWGQLVTSHTIFMQVSLAGLVPVLLAGILGGVVSAILAPRRKWLTTTLLGTAVSGTMLAYMLTHRMTAGSQNPMLWYWPAWVLPAFVIGGFLGRHVWVMPPNKSLRSSPSSAE